MAYNIVYKAYAERDLWDVPFAARLCVIILLYCTIFTHFRTIQNSGVSILNNPLFFYRVRLYVAM